jgi:hypothetical protein
VIHPRPLSREEILTEDLDNTLIAKLEDSGLDPSNDDFEAPPDVEGEVTFDEEEVEAPVEDASESVDSETTAEQTQKEIEDDLAEALGLGKPPTDPKKRAAWWNSRVPYSKIHKSVTAREKKLRDTHDGVLQEHRNRITEYDTRFADVQKVEGLIENHSQEYVRRLAELFPDTYGKMFAPILGGHNGTPAKLIEESDPGPKPEPDYRLPDGSMTYGIEGHQKLMEWQQKVTEQSMLKRFKPHLDFVQSQQKSQLAEQMRQEGLQTAKAAIEEVKAWPLAAENIEAIVAEAAKLDAKIPAFKALTLAYNKLIFPKMQLSQDELQAKIIADLKKRSAKKTSLELSQNKTNQQDDVSDDPGDPEEALNKRIKEAFKRKGIKLGAW